MDLQWLVEEDEDGSLIEKPSTTILVRSDSAGLLYPGRTHDLHGPPESGKSWVALLAIRDALIAGQKALFLDYEDAGPREIMDRLRRLGVSTEAILAGLVYVQPQGPPTGKHWEDLVYRNYGVAVIDAATGALAEMDRDGSSNSDVAVWAKSTVHPLAEGDTAVIVVDHTPLSANRVIGAVAKKGSLSGASYRVVATKPMVPGGIGVIDLHVVKDRPGAVRRQSAPPRKDTSQHAARITFDATDPFAIGVTVDPPATDSAARADPSAFTADQSEALRERLSRAVEQSAAPLSQNALAKAVGGDRNDALAQIRHLIAEGYLATEAGKYNAINHRSIRPYRAGEGK